MSDLSVVFPTSVIRCRTMYLVKFSDFEKHRFTSLVPSRQSIPRNFPKVKANNCIATIFAKYFLVVVVVVFVVYPLKRVRSLPSDDIIGSSQNVTS